MTILNKSKIHECFRNRDLIFNMVNGICLDIDAQDLFFIYKSIFSDEYEDKNTESNLLDDVYCYMDVVLEDFRLDSSHGKKGKEWAIKKSDQIKTTFKSGYDKKTQVEKLINLINK